MEKVNSPQEFKTKGAISIIGRSISVDLSDAGLEHHKSIHPHMTVVFFKGGYEEQDVKELNQLKQKFCSSNSLPEDASFSFTLEDWGKESKKIQGQLAELCLYLRQGFSGKQDAARIPHVQLIKGERSRRN